MVGIAHLTLDRHRCAGRPAARGWLAAAAAAACLLGPVSPAAAQAMRDVEQAAGTAAHGARPGAQDVRIITFQDAVRIALERNATLRQAQNTAELDAIAVEQARNQFLPDLQWNTRGTQNYGRNFNEAEGRIIDTSTRTVNLGLSSSVVLFNGFANVSNLRGARLARAASGLELQRTRETVAFTVATNFLALIQQREQLRVRRESLAAEAALEEQIGSYVEAGARTIADLYQQQANVANARFAVVQAERAAELAVVDLIDTLRLDVTGAYEFVVPELDPGTVSAERLALDALVAQALERRVDVDAQQARVGAAEQSARAARAGRWPTVSLTTGYSSSFNAASDFGFFDQLDQRRGGSVGLTFSIPLFDRGSTAVAARRAEIAQDNALLQLETRVQDVGLQVRRAWLDFTSAQEQLAAAQAQQRAADLALQATQERYEAGAATLVELSQARATQVQAASALVSARYNLLFQRTLVDYYSGDLNLAQLAGE